MTEPGPEPTLERKAERPLIARFVQNITLPRAMAAIMALTVMFTLLSALLMQVAEPETFDSYGRSWWWAVQTVATVGYGDITPHTIQGRLVATAVMIFGVALVPATTSIVVAVLLNRYRAGSN